MSRYPLSRWFNTTPNRWFMGAALGGMLALGCNNDPAAGKTKVEASAPVAPAPQPAAPAASAVTFTLAPTAGSIDFVGAKITDKHEGSFKNFSGAIHYIDGQIEKSHVTVSIDVNSLQVDPEKLRGHLLSADFFDVEKFPQATFSSTSIVAKPAGAATHEITGNLELHGVKKSITFPASITANDTGLMVAAEFAINRKDFNIVYPGKPDDLIKDDVLIKLKFNPKKG